MTGDLGLEVALSITHVKEKVGEPGALMSPVCLSRVVQSVHRAEGEGVRPYLLLGKLLC